MSKNKIIQKVYYSISNTEINTNLINDILEHSRKSNSKKNITGCLLYHNNVFLQLLEGEKSTVENLFSVIKQDSRHTEVTEIYDEMVTNRIFPTWSMAFHELDDTEEEVKKFIKSVHFFSQNNEKPTKAIDIFWKMAKYVAN